MSHDTHDTHHEHSESHHSHTEAHGHGDAHGHDHHGHDHTHNTPGTEDISKQTRISFKNAFWLIIIIVGLFVSALNFIQVEKGGETEDHAPTREILETGAGHTGKGAENKEMQAEHEAIEEAHNVGADTAGPTHESGAKATDQTPAEAAPAEHEAGH